jgi:hypothetical protein
MLGLGHELNRNACLQAQGALPLAEMPAWTLPDDDSGLDAMLRSQIRMHRFLTHAQSRPMQASSIALANA